EGPGLPRWAIMDNTEAPAGPTVWRLRGSSATDSRDCLATDWWGLLLAHNVAGNLEKAITAAVAAGRQLGDVLEAHPEVVVDPVVEDLRHEPASPLAARIDGMARRSVLALDPFSTGFWQVETVSGSRHILDLTGGGYRRISDVPFGEMDDDWYGIESLHEWP